MSTNNLAAVRSPARTKPCSVHATPGPDIAVSGHNGVRCYRERVRDHQGTFASLTARTVRAVGTKQRAHDVGRATIRLACSWIWECLQPRRR